MPHYSHLTSLGELQLYHRGEALIGHQLDMLDEILNRSFLPGHLRRAATQAKDALAELRSRTLQPRRWQGPSRETVETAAPVQDPCTSMQTVPPGYCGDPAQDANPQSIEDSRECDQVVPTRK